MPSSEIHAQQIAAYLTRNRSLAEVATEFGLKPRDAKVAIDALVSIGYDIVEGPRDIHGHKTFVAVPDAGLEAPLPPSARLWRWQEEANGQPYGAVFFPASYQPEKIKIIPLDGIHYGSPVHDERLFDALIQKVASEPNTFVFLNGDAISEITGGHRQHREALLLDRSSAFIRKLQPIMSKILWAQQGCLEARASSQQGFDPLEYLCTKLDIPYFKEPVYIDLHWAGNLWTLWAMHGQSTAQMKGSRLNALRRPAVIQDWTHFVIMGHVGDAMWNRNIRIVRDPAACKLVPREEFHVILGNFKRFLGTPSAKRGHQPPSNEVLTLHLYPDGQHHVKTLHLGAVGVGT